MAQWIAKPLSQLNEKEVQIWNSMVLSGLPLSQGIAWGRAIQASGGECFIVFSPERRVSALFMVAGIEAECVNGPVMDWARTPNAQELNEQFGMVVYALHQCLPRLKKIRLRPRLSLEGLDFLRAHLAFPMDRVDQARTRLILLESTPESHWVELSPRIRQEISRAQRSGVTVSVRDAQERFKDFWDQVRAFYQARGLYAPEDSFVEALLQDSEMRGQVISSRHEPSRSFCEILVINYKGVGYYFYAHESRGETCPKVSLNVCAQWEAMKELIARGVKGYDLNGILHPDHQNAENAAYAGVDAYKRKFRGETVDYASPLICFGDAP
jgi:hypothetical protein